MAAELATPTDTVAPRWDRWLAGRSKMRAARNLQRSDSSRGTLFDLASNDYLGLSRHPQVRRAVADAVRAHGAGATASRVATGTLPVHRELERALCGYAGRDAALVFSSGYTANLGVLGALGGPGSVFILDEHAHASLIDGARLSGARVLTAQHNDLAQVRRMLSEHQGQRVMLVVESVYSVFGDACDLPAAAALCAEFGALLLVDEAHSMAVLPAGSALRAAGLQDAGHVLATATLSKALGAQGGAVLLGGEHAGRLRNHLLNTARTFLFDTALAPTAAAAALAALRLADPARRQRLAENSALLHDTLAAIPGLEHRVERGAGAVHSVRMPGAQAAVDAARALADAGIAVACFRPPSVPDGISRLRLTAHADHDPQALRVALALVAQKILQEDPR